MTYETDWEYCTASVVGWDRYDAKNIDSEDEIAFRFDVYVGKWDWGYNWRIEMSGFTEEGGKIKFETEEGAFIAAMLEAADYFLNNPRKYIAIYSHGKLGDLVWKAGFDDLFKHIARKELVNG